MTFEIAGPFRRPARPGSALPPAGGGAPPRPLAVWAKPMLRVSTLRREGLVVNVRADRPGAYRVRLVIRVGGRTVTLATGTRKVTKAGTVRIRVRVPASARQDLRELRGRRVDAQLVLTVGRRRATRPIVLARGS